MPATTKGLRYPANTDAVTDGALAIEHLAEDVDAKLGQPHHLVAQAIADVPLRVDAMAGQTGDLMEAFDAAGVQQFRVSAGGAVVVGPGVGAVPALPGTQLAVIARVTNNLMVYMRKMAAMTGDLFRVDDENGNGLLAIDKNGHLCGRPGAAGPTVAAGAAMGTAPPAPVLNRGNDQAGRVTFGTGTAPAAGVLLTITYNRAYSASPMVLVQQDTGPGALDLYCSNAAAGAITVSCRNAPAASQAANTYGLMYQVIGQ